MTLGRSILPTLLLLGCLFTGATPAAAQTRGPGPGPTGTAMSVRVGWGGVVQSGRWHPVYVTLADPVPRGVTFEFRAPHGSFYGMRSRQVLAIGPEPQTFVVYMPLRHFMPEDLSFIVRDATTRRKLADYPATPFVSFAAGDHASPGFSVLGVSGRRATLRPLTDALPGAKLVSGHVEWFELPSSAVGYDCLDALVLNAPDLTALSDEQQQAIAEWVRGGGNLLMWPGDSPVPEAGPLIDVLPARIGGTDVVQLSPEELNALGMTQRFSKLPARVLTPSEDAEPLTLLGLERVTGYQRRLGLGRVIVCPVDLASLQVRDPQKVWALWKPVLKPMIRRLPDDPVTPPENQYDVTNETQAREATALRQVGDMLGAVPGAGQFGFGYVAGVLIAMMVIVGPLDWVLLKKLGRQPWTWATTTGWIALVTLSAVYVGNIFKSGDLHFRTFQLVDQADGLAVARTDVSALYSPRTTEYEFATRPDEWWQPASPGDEFYGYRRSAQEVSFAQTYRGSRPDPMVVNVWNLRFMQGTSSTAAPALVDANLKVERRQVDGKPRPYLVGTVTNIGTEPLVNVAVRTQAGWARLFSSAATDTQPAQPTRIEPGQTAQVDSMISVTPGPRTYNNDWRQRGYPGNAPQLDPNRLWDQGGDLSMRRTDRIEQWVSERADLACVYAECEKPSPVIEMEKAEPIEQHWKVVRALVPLGG